MPKPALADLIKKTKSKRKKKAPATPSARVKPPSPPPPQTLPGSAPALPDKRSELRREIFVRRFVTEYLRHHMEAAPAYQAARAPVVVKPSSAAANAYRLLQCDDVKAELQRQLAPIIEELKLDQEWVKRQWAAMAEANIFDYVTVNARGGATEYRLDRSKLTLPQQQNVQGLRFDKNGTVTHIQLVSRADTVMQIARANKMYSEIDNEDLSALAKEITDRMQRASKMLPHQPRTFDGKTGEEIK